MHFFRDNGIGRWILIGSLLFISCAGTEPEENKEADSKGIRIQWDNGTLVKIAPHEGRSVPYCGYARMIELRDGRLACVYEASPGNTELVFSNDKGSSWGYPQIVFETKENKVMAVPEIIQLKDNSILVACNPRPREPYSPDRKFGIAVRKSKDGGNAWSQEKVVYEAQSTFRDGCWEPSFVQLPGGEIQLFFANEGPYTTSNEQEISFLRSTDNGESWSAKAETAGFRPGRRDGMPVPLLLADRGELLVAVEDNKTVTFKPAIYREKLSDNWGKGVISGDDPRRNYHPLEDKLPEQTYAGAPYLARLASGEILLSYQMGRTTKDPVDQSYMVVESSDSEGKIFNRRSVPFVIPPGKKGIWNSMAVINGNTPVAITSTNAFSTGQVEVWMIKGTISKE